MSSAKLSLNLSDAARSDLSDITTYTLEHFGEQQAEKYTSMLLSGFLTLRQSPTLGKKIRRFRRYSCGKHYIFYAATSRQLKLIRILHTRMDSVRHLPD